VLHAARWKYRTQKIAKNSPSAHHRTTLSSSIFATKARIDNRKKLVKQQYFLHMTHNMVNFGPLAAEIDWRVWAPQQISTGFAFWLCYCSDVAHRKSTKLCTMLGRLLGWYTIYSFSGALARDGILPRAIFKSFVVLFCQRYCTALQQRASAKLRRGTRNGITELSHTAPPIFGLAAITLGIGPHF